MGGLYSRRLRYGIGAIGLVFVLLAAVWLPKVLATDYDPRNVDISQKAGVTLGMAMTEKQGYDAGFQQGLNEGRSQGLQQAQTEQQPVLDHWRQLAQEFQHSLQAMDNVIAARLMQMALTAAKQIIGQSPL